MMPVTELIIANLSPTLAGHSNDYVEGKPYNKSWFDDDEIELDGVKNDTWNIKEPLWDSWDLW